MIRTAERTRTADVAVIIPCHNGAKFLPHALDSVLAQTVAPTAVYVVDDASTDETRWVAGRYAARYSHIRCLHLPRNVGPATARNLALEHAGEEYIAFLDADDHWRPNHLETLLTLLEPYPTVALAFGRVAVRGGDPPDTPLSEPGRPTSMLPTLLVDNLITQSSVLARRSALEAVGAYRSGLRYAEDYDLWLRLALKYPFVYSDDVTCVRQYHDAQATRRERRMLRGAWEARLRLWEMARRNGRISDRLFQACVDAAFELHLAIAWRSRDREGLRHAVEIAPIVPGGVQRVERWRWRVRLLWPFWRAAAGVWDALPESVRAPLRARRVRRARDRADRLRAVGFRGAAPFFNRANGRN